MRRLPKLPHLCLTTAILLVAPGCSGGSANAEGSGTDETGEDESADDSDTDTSAGTGDTPLEPAAGGIRRLLGRQFTASVSRMLGSEAAAAAQDALPTDWPLNEFDAIGAAQLSLADPDIEQYELASIAAADATVANLDALGDTAPCVLEADPADSCYDEVAASLGHFAWRRPLDDDELGRLTDIGVAGREWGEGEFTVGLKYMLMAILESPHFIYLKEVGVEDEESGYRKLQAAELLSRASFFLIGRTPDLWMLEKAESGDLDEDGALRSLANALVTDSAARTNMAEFYDELYRLREVPTMQKSPDEFPVYDSDLAETMRQGTLAFIEHVIWEENADSTALLTANYTFVNEDTAPLYGISGVSGAGFQQADFPGEQNRAGFLTQAAFLTRHSHPAKNSPTRRGVFIQTKILCATLDPPPPGVDTNLPDDDGEPKTLREKLEAHMDDESCAGCHALMDPMGFALENYNPIGVFRTEEPNGLPIDATGEIAGLGSFANAAELSALLRDDPRTAQCVIRNLIRNGLGHIETPGETPSIVVLSDGFTDNDFNLQDLLVEMAASQLFQLVDEPK